MHQEAETSLLKTLIYLSSLPEEVTCTKEGMLTRLLSPIQSLAILFYQICQGGIYICTVWKTVTMECLIIIFPLPLKYIKSEATEWCSTQLGGSVYEVLFESNSDRQMNILFAS